jgi:hypothetical protein
MEYKVSENSTINGVTIEITQTDGFKSSPSYEAHSIAKVNEIIAGTLSLVPEGTKLEVIIY